GARFPQTQCAVSVAAGLRAAIIHLIPADRKSQHVTICAFRFRDWLIAVRPRWFLAAWFGLHPPPAPPAYAGEQFVANGGKWQRSTREQAWCVDNRHQFPPR